MVIFKAGSSGPTALIAAFSTPICFSSKTYASKLPQKSCDPSKIINPINPVTNFLKFPF